MTIKVNYTKEKGLVQELDVTGNGGFFIEGNSIENSVDLVIEDIVCNEVTLGVAVLACLRGRHVCHLARLPFDHDQTPFADLARLHGNRLGGASFPAAEVVVFYCCHSSF